MLKRVAWAKYWPAILFAVSNVAAIALVVRAQTSYDPISTPTFQSQPQAHDDEFAPLDSADPAQAMGGNVPLILDWGKEFNVDEAAAEKASSGLLGRLTRGVDNLRGKVREAVDAKARAEREALLLREPLRFSMVDNLGRFQGVANYIPPPDFPPLSALPPLQPATFDTASGPAKAVRTGANSFTLQIDPELMKDEAYMQGVMAAALNALRDSTRDEIVITRTPAAGGGSSLVAQLPPATSARPGTAPAIPGAAVRPLAGPGGDIATPRAAPTPARLPGVTGTDPIRLPPREPAVDRPRPLLEPAQPQPERVEVAQPPAATAQPRLDLPTEQRTSAAPPSQSRRARSVQVTVKATAAEAQAVVQRLRDEGITASASPGGNGEFVIRTARYDDVRELLQRLGKLGYTGAYIL